MVDPASPPLPPEAYATFLRDRRKTDANYQRALAIFHYLLAALTAAIFTYMVRGFFQSRQWRREMADSGRMASMNNLAALDGLTLGLIAVYGLTLALNAASGWCLMRRKVWTVSVVVAGLELIYFPLGTVLGVFTVIVLLRGSVTEWYKETAAGTGPGVGPVRQPPTVRPIVGS